MCINPNIFFFTHFAREIIQDAMLIFPYNYHLVLPLSTLIQLLPLYTCSPWLIPNIMDILNEWPPWVGSKSSPMYSTHNHNILPQIPIQLLILHYQTYQTQTLPTNLKGTHIYFLSVSKLISHYHPMCHYFQLKGQLVINHRGN